MQFFLRRNIKIALFNLAIVATLGFLLRAKIAFPIPFIEQKHFLHGHSHFALSGWISHLLMVLLLMRLPVVISPKLQARFRLILILNLVCAYGMALAFCYQGYATISIIFSTASILVAYFFTATYFSATAGMKSNNLPWARTALFFNVFSSLGTWVLAFMMFMHVESEQGYLSTVLFFLHFQYNGWFIFAGVYLALDMLRQEAVAKIPAYVLPGAALSCAFTYVLSLPVMLEIPWLMLLCGISAVFQLYFFAVIFNRVKLGGIKPGGGIVSLWLFRGALLALALKLVLQCFSAVPMFAQFAFGSRPIIIGYLHLVFLLIVSFFLLAYLLAGKLVHNSQAMRIGMVIFAIGALLNETLLLTQAIGNAIMEPIGAMPYYLLTAAFLLCAGGFIIFFSAIKKENGRGDHVVPADAG